MAWTFVSLCDEDLLLSRESRGTKLAGRVHAATLENASVCE